MAWGIGVDLVEPERLQQRMTAHPDLVDQLFTVGEQRYCQEQLYPSQHFAARFCAKEAVVKAMGVDGWDPLEVEIRPGDPAPLVHLYGDMAQHAARLDVQVSISLSHLPAMAIAMAIAVPRLQSLPLYG
jgi:holo-[acyl-carrier protein] synthase